MMNVRTATDSTTQTTTSYRQPLWSDFEYDEFSIIEPGDAVMIYDATFDVWREARYILSDGSGEVLVDYQQFGEHEIWVFEEHVWAIDEWYAVPTYLRRTLPTVA